MHPMSAPEVSPPATVSWTQCRRAARAVKASPHHRQVIDVVRPRGVTGVLRSRAPLPFILLLAAYEDRLIWRSIDGFAILETPTGQPADAARSPGWLRMLTLHWDVWIFALLPLTGLLLAAAVAGAFPALAPLALWLVVVVLVTVAAGMLALILAQARRLVRGRRRLRETAVDQVRSQHWTIVMVNVANPAAVPAILREARRHAAERDPVLCLERGITTEVTLDAVRAAPGCHRLASEVPVLVLAQPSDLPLRAPEAPGRFQGRDVGLVLGGSAVVVALVARMVRDAEHELCQRRPAGCDERPTTHGDALYWVFSRVLGGDPEGLGVAHPASRVVGLLLSFYGLFVLVEIIGRVVQQRIDEDISSGPQLVRAFNERLRGPETESSPTEVSPVQAPASALPHPRSDPPRRNSWRDFPGLLWLATASALVTVLTAVFTVAVLAADRDSVAAIVSATASALSATGTLLAGVAMLVAWRSDRQPPPTDVGPDTPAASDAPEAGPLPSTRSTAGGPASRESPDPAGGPPDEQDDRQ